MTEKHKNTPEEQKILDYIKNTYDTLTNTFSEQLKSTDTILKNPDGMLIFFVDTNNEETIIISLGRGNEYKKVIALKYAFGV